MGEPLDTGSLSSASGHVQDKQNNAVSCFKALFPSLTSTLWSLHNKMKSPLAMETIMLTEVKTVLTVDFLWTSVNS